MTTAAMAQVDDGGTVNHEVHFLNSDNPRHGLVVMSMNPPTYYEFRTFNGLGQTHTTVRVDPPPL